MLFPKQTLIHFDIEYNIFDLFYFFGEAKNITTQYHIISYCVSCEQSIRPLSPLSVNSVSCVDFGDKIPFIQVHNADKIHVDRYPSKKI